MGFVQCPYHDSHPKAAQVWITQFYLQTTPYLPLPHKHSPDGATTDCCVRHIIAAYYLFIDPKRMKGWVGLVGRHIVEGLPRSTAQPTRMKGCARDQMSSGECTHYLVLDSHISEICTHFGEFAAEFFYYLNVLKNWITITSMFVKVLTK